MTTEERIAELDEVTATVMDVLQANAPSEGVFGHETALAVSALTLQVQALRLMLREEIREAAWRLAEPGQPHFVTRPYDQEAADEPTATARYGPLPSDQQDVPERLVEAVEGKDVP